MKVTQRKHMIPDRRDEAWNMFEHRKALEKYPKDPNAEVPWVNLKEIVVETERDKQQVLAAFKYLHDNFSIDTDFIAVNTLVHVYSNPDMVKVRP